jgi:hypothetical protein
VGSPMEKGSVGEAAGCSTSKRSDSHRGWVVGWMEAVLGPGAGQTEAVQGSGTAGGRVGPAAVQAGPGTGSAAGATEGGGARRVRRSDGGCGGRWRSPPAGAAEGEVGRDSLRRKEEADDV